MTTPHPSIPGLLGYVTIVTAGSTAVMRWRGWSWLAWLALGGALIWALAAIAAEAARRSCCGRSVSIFWRVPLLFLLVPDAVREGAPACAPRRPGPPPSHRRF